MGGGVAGYHRPHDGRGAFGWGGGGAGPPAGGNPPPPPARPGGPRAPLPAGRGQPRWYDYEYVRRGTANVFMAFQPLLGWRAAQVTERRTAADFAEALRWLVEDLHEEARTVVLVTDNLNTHTPG